jgi:hypothetical protein
LAASFVELWQLKLVKDQHLIQVMVNQTAADFHIFVQMKAVPEMDQHPTREMAFQTAVGFDLD